jgi:arsenite-transporting ATPase
MALQDVDFAKILLVSLPETTPMREAEGLQNDLQRAGIVPFAWVINQSFASLSQLKDPVLRKKASAEIPIIQYVENNLSTKTFCIPYISESNMLPALLNLYDK